MAFYTGESPLTEKNTRKESPLPDDKKGDELLKRMLKTPPKPHKSDSAGSSQGEVGKGSEQAKAKP